MKNNTECVFDSIWLCHEFGHKENLYYELCTTSDTSNEALTVGRNGAPERLFRLCKYTITKSETGLYQCINDNESIYVTLSQLLTQFTIAQDPFELCDTVNISNIKKHHLLQMMHRLQRIMKKIVIQTRQLYSRLIMMRSAILLKTQGTTDQFH